MTANCDGPQHQKNIFGVRASGVPCQRGSLPLKYRNNIKYTM